MTWSVTVPGQPVSWDAAYPTGRMPVKRGGKAVLNADGSQKMIHRPIKSKEAAKYQDDVILVTKAARPSSWRPTGQVRVFVSFYLTRDMDADNALKMLLDAVAKAIDIDDIRFLPCVRTKVSGVPLRDARVELTFEEVA